MIKLSKVILLAALLAFAGISCQQGSNPVENHQSPPTHLNYTLPGGATFNSASLNVYVNQAYNHQIDLHRITGDWDENTITWNSFSGSFAPAVENSFVTDSPGWHSIDVSALVMGWINGDYADYGVLLKNNLLSWPTDQYFAKENGTEQPYLEICYTLPDGAVVCDQIFPTDDAYIWADAAGDNYGTRVVLYTGWSSETDLELQAMLKFDIEVSREPAAIGDYAWIDANDNGIQDMGEAGFPGVVVNLYTCEGDFVATTITDANGYYQFANLNPGDFYIEFISPEGYIFSPQDVGNDATDSDADPITGFTACTNLVPGEYDDTWDAGFYRPGYQGCTLTIGFWKNHAGFGPQENVVSPLLPLWLGTEGGLNSIAASDSTTAHDILTQQVYGDPSNGITKLYAQMLAARLNIANGADAAAVSDALAAADAFLTSHDWNDWNDDLSSADKKMITGWKSIFDDFNNGIIGPGHCGD